jgi:hypothetical protein
VDDAISHAVHDIPRNLGRAARQSGVCHTCLVRRLTDAEGTPAPAPNAPSSYGNGFAQDPVARPPRQAPRRQHIHRYAQ